MLKALSLVGSARIVSTAAQAVTLLLMARSLGPSGFAEFAGVLGGLMALGILADGGATYALGRHHESASLTCQIMRAGRLLSAGTMVVSVPVLATLAFRTGSPVLLACLPLCLWVPWERQLEVSSAYLLARKREQVVAAGYLARRVPTLLAVLAVPPTVSPVPAFALSMVVAAGASLLGLRRYVSIEVSAAGGVAQDEPPIRRLLPDAGTWSVLRPFWAAIAGQGVRQLDVAVLSFAAGTAVAGAFAPAIRLVPALLLVPGTYTQMLLGRLASSRKELTTEPLLVVTAVSTAVFVPLSLTAQFWIPLLLGPAYASTVDVVRIIIISLVFATLSSVFASGLHSADLASRVAAGVWTSATVTLVLIAYLGSTYGAVGAAFAVAGGYLLQFVLMAACYLRRPTRKPLHAKRRARST